MPATQTPAPAAFTLTLTAVELALLSQYLDAAGTADDVCPTLSANDERTLDRVLDRIGKANEGGSACPNVRNHAGTIVG